MAKAQRGTAEAFLMALKALPKAERDAVVVRIAGDKGSIRDILDPALMAKPRGEPSRPFRGCLRITITDEHLGRDPVRRCGT